MRVKWSDGAAEDLTEIVAYIKRDSPDAARRVARKIYDLSMSLAAFPRKGHLRKSGEGYQLLCSPWPYFIIYEVVGEAVVIAGIVHAARDRST